MPLLGCISRLAGSRCAGCTVARLSLSGGGGFWLSGGGGGFLRTGCCFSLGPVPACVGVVVVGGGGGRAIAKEGPDTLRKGTTTLSTTPSPLESSSSVSARPLCVVSTPMSMRGSLEMPP